MRVVFNVVAAVAAVVALALQPTVAAWPLVADPTPTTEMSPREPMTNTSIPSPIPIDITPTLPGNLTLGMPCGGIAAAIYRCQPHLECFVANTLVSDAQGVCIDPHTTRFRGLGDSCGGRRMWMHALQDVCGVGLVCRSWSGRDGGRGVCVAITFENSE
ncbi:hypothetical protein BC831DRAFT_447259 [Entophlyctis helioformis]|nr:hypothetical protein BC831DRAFT_447259 [Entophlyctis helioformis]